MRSVVAITGASGAAYGIRLLQTLPGEKVLVLSKTAESIIPEETGMSLDEVRQMADECYDDTDMYAPVASGSVGYDILFVCPCTASSVQKFAAGIADTLISRVFMCALKEGRKTVLVVRETPKSAIMLENELKLARLGVVIMDANPAFYPRPETVSDMVDFVVGKCLSQAGVDQHLYAPWKGGRKDRSRPWVRGRRSV